MEERSDPQFDLFATEEEPVEMVIVRATRNGNFTKETRDGIEITRTPAQRRPA